MISGKGDGVTLDNNNRIGTVKRKTGQSWDLVAQFIRHKETAEFPSAIRVNVNPPVGDTSHFELTKKCHTQRLAEVYATEYQVELVGTLPDEFSVWVYFDNASTHPLA